MATVFRVSVSVVELTEVSVVSQHSAALQSAFEHTVVEDRGAYTTTHVKPLLPHVVREAEYKTQTSDGHWKLSERAIPNIKSLHTGAAG